jgi:hypothetical protein
LVWGLSTRKVRTPWSIQNSTVRRISSHRGRGSSPPKFRG